jgi:hypothetical protein
VETGSASKRKRGTQRRRLYKGDDGKQYGNRDGFVGLGSLAAP